MNVLMLFDIISKDLMLDNNSVSPFDMRVRGQVPVNFMVTIWLSTQSGIWGREGRKNSSVHKNTIFLV